MSEGTDARVILRRGHPVIPIAFLAASLRVGVEYVNRLARRHAPALNRLLDLAADADASTHLEGYLTQRQALFLCGKSGSQSAGDAAVAVSDAFREAAENTGGEVRDDGEDEGAATRRRSVDLLALARRLATHRLKSAAREIYARYETAARSAAALDQSGLIHVDACSETTSPSAPSIGRHEQPSSILSENEHTFLAGMKALPPEKRQAFLLKMEALIAYDEALRDLIVLADLLGVRSRIVEMLGNDLNKIRDGSFDASWRPPGSGAPFS